MAKKATIIILSDQITTRARINSPRLVHVEQVGHFIMEVTDSNVLPKKITPQTRWDEAFAKSNDSPVQLAEEALIEYKEGETIRLDPNNL